MTSISKSAKLSVSPLPPPTLLSPPRLARSAAVAATSGALGLAIGSEKVQLMGGLATWTTPTCDASVVGRLGDVSVV